MFGFSIHIRHITSHLYCIVIYHLCLIYNLSLLKPLFDQKLYTYTAKMGCLYLSRISLFIILIKHKFPILDFYSSKLICRNVSISQRINNSFRILLITRNFDQIFSFFHLLYKQGHIKSILYSLII